MVDITALQTSVTQLTGIVAQMPPVLQANADLGTRIIGVLEDVLKQLGTTGPTQADIDALTSSVTTSLSGLSADIAAVNATNATLQAEIAKVAPSATAPSATATAATTTPTPTTPASSSPTTPAA